MSPTTLPTGQPSSGRTGRLDPVAGTDLVGTSALVEADPGVEARLRG